MPSDTAGGVRCGVLNGKARPGDTDRPRRRRPDQAGRAADAQFYDWPAVRERPSWPAGSAPPQTDRIYEGARTDGNSVSDRSLDIRKESIYALPAVLLSRSF